MSCEGGWATLQRLVIYSSSGVTPEWAVVIVEENELLSMS